MQINFFGSDWWTDKIFSINLINVCLSHMCVSAPYECVCLSHMCICLSHVWQVRLGLNRLHNIFLKNKLKKTSISLGKWTWICGLQLYFGHLVRLSQNTGCGICPGMIFKRVWHLISVCYAHLLHSFFIIMFWIFLKIWRLYLQPNLIYEDTKKKKLAQKMGIWHTQFF